MIYSSEFASAAYNPAAWPSWESRLTAQPTSSNIASQGLGGNPFNIYRPDVGLASFGSSWTPNVYGMSNPGCRSLFECANPLARPYLQLAGVSPYTPAGLFDVNRNMATPLSTFGVPIGRTAEPCPFGGVATVQHILKDLVEDRTRDYKNLELINDLLDVSQESKHLLMRNVLSGYPIPAELQQILARREVADGLLRDTVRQVVNDAKYNRHIDDMIGALSTGRPYVGKVDWEGSAKKNCAVDQFLINKARQTAQVASFGLDLPLSANRATKRAQSIMELQGMF